MSNGIAHGHEKGTTGEGPAYAHSPILLSPAQYERLFFQPGGGPPRSTHFTPRQFGNPTAFAIVSYLLTLTPTVCMLMRWDGSAPTSFPGIIGVFYFIGGLGMTVGGIMEWVMGNTFPFVVFSSFGGFWRIASAFPDGGTNAATFNHGVQLYFTFWAVMCFVYFLAALRTNIVFVYVFATLVLTFAFLAAAYHEAGVGNATKSLMFLRFAGAFGFANITGGWYLGIVLIFAAVEMPVFLPVGDLSGFLKKKKAE
ncbi:GPR1/FUN34/yaaH family-domain-containing protein [Roridomyces roridus]|uniref:GPR1/FUN34/yaaH family-domain-containing protein n=1 Tax=Roridomyces roridus TaxID=1738132 RepID=A0AAD7BEK4_9AGAR|nr:GPR1/FUN34/yaaH family-domain-containing protein [Roridomyces roridus]